MPQGDEIWEYVRQRTEELLSRPPIEVDENQGEPWDDLVADSNAKAEDAWRQYVQEPLDDDADDE